MPDELLLAALLAEQHRRWRNAQIVRTALRPQITSDDRVHRGVRRMLRELYGHSEPAAVDPALFARCAWFGLDA
jgi:hypothetical protein